MAVLALIGTPFYSLCSHYHFCKCGHLQHGPYPWYYWANDFVWTACFFAVFVFSLFLRTKRRKWFLYISISLIISSTLFGGLFGGVTGSLLIIMDVYSILYIVKPDKYLIATEQNTSENINSNTIDDKGLDI
jgi:hypothetical protein